jgi:hypothetical protein
MDLNRGGAAAALAQLELEALRSTVNFANCPTCSTSILPVFHFHSTIGKAMNLNVCGKREKARKWWRWRRSDRRHGSAIWRAWNCVAPFLFSFLSRVNASSCNTRKIETVHLFLSHTTGVVCFHRYRTKDPGYKLHWCRNHRKRGLWRLNVWYSYRICGGLFTYTILSPRNHVSVMRGQILYYSFQLSSKYLWSCTFSAEMQTTEHRWEWAKFRCLGMRPLDWCLAILQWISGSKIAWQGHWRQRCLCVFAETEDTHARATQSHLISYPKAIGNLIFVWLRVYTQWAYWSTNPTDICWKHRVPRKIVLLYHFDRKFSNA